MNGPAKTTKSDDPDLNRLRSKIEQEVSQLRTLRDRQRESEKTLAELEGVLAAIREEKAAREAERATLDNASAVALHRIGVTAGEAVKKIDALTAEINSAAGQQAVAEEKRGRIAEDLSNAKAQLPPLIERIVFSAATYSKGELLAHLSSMVDSGSFDLSHFFEHQFSFFDRTIVAGVYEDRIRAVKRGEALTILDEVISDPIVPLQQRPAVLPISQGSLLIQEIRRG
jgi:hypothetical protein